MKKIAVRDLLKVVPGGIFTWSYFAILVFCILIFLIDTKAEIQLAVNSIHSPFLDALLKNWTHLADGILLLVILISLSFLSFRLFFTGLTASILGGLFAQFIKHVFFPHSPRPLKYFELHQISEQLYLVPGVHMHTWLSFPSGHTATAFALFFSIALSVRSNFLRFLLFLLAAGVGLSRIYLSQHFLIDVVGGSILGMLMGGLAWQIFSKLKRNWIDRNIYFLFSK